MNSVVDHERLFSIDAAARECPDALVVIGPADSLTYAEVARRARRVAVSLSRAGRSEGPVAVVPTLRAETIVAILALVQLGAPVVLIHPRLTPVERAVLVRSAGATVELDETWTDIDLPEPPGEERVHPASTLALASPMAILFTSGSTGMPKGVLLSRHAFAAATAASAANLGWHDDDRWLLCMPVAHVGGLSVIVRCVAARIPIVMSPWTGSTNALLADVVRHRVTILSLVPTMLARILREGPARPFPDHVRAVFIGGDAARPALLREAVERGVPVLTTYGLTEACSQVATQTYGEAPSFDGFIGPPVPGVEVRIVKGEIHVRGPNLLTGYFPVGRFASPFVEDGWLPTGDDGELDARGRLRVRGRRSDLIITGGENVDPAEVELALSACPGIRDVCVFGIADERWGQIVAAAIVAQGRADAPSMALVASHVRATLATHKQPRVAAFCDAIVLNATGKVNRRATADLVASALVPLPR